MDARPDDILLSVAKPARYIGREWNSVTKDWSENAVKILLAFPDVYEVGMSYLGLKILYGILNGRQDCLCERAFSPWPDFEELLRKGRMPFLSLESRHPVREFDIIGFTLAYELNYTNVLNMLDLGGIPVRSSGRNDDDPIVIAGGPSCHNPEPMAEFIDAFVIGEGEEAILEIVEVYKNSEFRNQRSKSEKERKTGAVALARKELLRALAALPGVYVPSLYKIEYDSKDSAMARFLPVDECAPPRIKKRIVKDLDNSFYPVDQIVPYIQIVHDRITLEIMRGCKHACRFCQAGTTYRPCRERSREKILKLAKESYIATGYEEVSLLSLSSVDHSQIAGIIEDLNSLFKTKAVSISVPSLRPEKMLICLPRLISEVRKTGLTFAPEAGSDCLRSAINKDIDIERLFETVLESFRQGWQRVKLYFMIGLPAEKEEDLAGIIELTHKVSDLRRQVAKGSAYVTASINAFVPKPHTPFQWEAMETILGLGEKERWLKSRVKSKRIKLDFHSFEMAFLEAVFSRGDRRLGGVIEEAWRGGCRFDGWRDLFDAAIWSEAFKKHGVDPCFYARRERPFDEVLPWDFIDIGIEKEWLKTGAPSRGL